MIDKDKLIESLEGEEIEITRDQIDWLCDNGEKYCGKFQKPYEINIDFGPIFIGIFAQLAEFSDKLKRLENQFQLSLIAPQETDECTPPKTDRIESGSEESSDSSL